MHYGVALGILVGLWYFDRLRLDDFLRAGLDWTWTFASLALFLPIYLLAALRLQCILRGMHVECTYRQSLSFTFCGMIGELALPFFIGGDLVKAVYVGRSATRSAALASVLADRIVGLLGLCVFALLAAAFQVSTILEDERLFNAMATLLGVSGCCLLGCAMLVLFHRSAGGWVKHVLEKLPGGAKLLSVLRVLKSLCRGPHLWSSLALSVCGHAVWTMAVLCLAQALHLDPPIVPTLLVLPIVAFCNTLSFAGGIGGGLLAFEYLFHHVLGAAPGDGARLGVALPIVLTLSKVYALPWLFFAGKSPGERPA